MYKKIIFLLVLFSIKNLNSQTYSEVSSSSGIDHVFKQFSAMGGGAVFFDYDNDGWEDLYVTSGFDKDHLYRNMGNGTFSKVTSSWLDITEDFYTTGVVSGDVNNDGNRDLLVTTWREFVNGNMTGTYQRNLLFINNGNGTFTEKGLDYNLSENSFSMGAIMLDYNNDSLLDIYVINYIENSVPLYDNNGNVDGFDHDCFKNFLYLNNGDNTFTNVSSTSGADNAGCGLAVMPTDFDQDNDQDIYVANDFGEFVIPNSMLENGTSGFTDVSIATNMNIGIYAMGISYADFDKDLDYDYYISNLGRNVLLQNNGSQVFTDIATAAGVENTYAENNNNTLFTTSWGTAFFDFNNDTWPDLFVANGRVPAADFIATGEDDPNKLYLNKRDGTFEDISNTTGVNDYARGRGMAYADYDKDGDIDMVVVVQDGSQNSAAKTTLYQNQLNPNGSGNDNWVQFQLRGTSINKDAIGAKVEILVNGETLIQEVHGQGSHCSQHSLTLHFGLEAATEIDELKVIWSNSYTQIFTDLEINKKYNIVEGESLGVNNNQLETFLSYPNPVKDILSFSNIDADFEVKIYDLYGKLIASKTINKTNPFINISSYSTGTYIVDLINKNNSKIRSKQLIIKE